MLKIGVDPRSHSACPTEAEHEPADRRTASPTEALVTPESPLRLVMEERRHTGAGRDLGLATSKLAGFTVGWECFTSSSQTTRLSYGTSDLPGKTTTIILTPSYPQHMVQDNRPSDRQPNRPSSFSLISRKLATSSALPGALMLTK